VYEFFIQGLTVTVQELLQLYAPLAGLLCVVFWLGVLSERVATLKTRVIAAELEISGMKGDDGAGVGRVIRLEVQMENLSKTIESVQRSIDGFQRQFANLMQKSSPRTNGT
jgi:hypothetical protein